MRVNDQDYTVTERKRTRKIDWEDLRFFVALAEEGTLSGAARRLGVNHATVSRRAARLETSLGVVLFDRRETGFGLTAEGEAVLMHARPMSEAALAIRHDLDAGARAGGTVRITCTPALADRWLVGSLVPFRASNPTIDVEVFASTQSLSLGRWESDIAIRLARPLDGELLCRRATSLAFALYACHDMAAAVENGDGERHPVVGYPPDETPLPESRALAGWAGGRRMAFRSNSLSAQIEAVEAGFGIGMLPCYLADASPHLSRIRCAEDLPSREVWILARRDVARRPRVRALLDHLFARFEKDRAAFAGTVLSEPRPDCTISPSPPLAPA